MGHCSVSIILPDRLRRAWISPPTNISSKEKLLLQDISLKPRGWVSKRSLFSAAMPANPVLSRHLLIKLAFLPQNTAISRYKSFVLYVFIISSTVFVMKYPMLLYRSSILLLYAIRTYLIKYKITYRWFSQKRVDWLLSYIFCDPSGQTQRERLRTLFGFAASLFTSRRYDCKPFNHPEAIAESSPLVFGRTATP